MFQHDVSRERRASVETVLARIATDPGYRKSLKDDPAAAIRALAIDPAAEAPADVFGLCRSVTCRPKSCRYSILTR
jgi:hypothetical protein